MKSERLKAELKNFRYWTKGLRNACYKLQDRIKSESDGHSNEFVKVMTKLTWEIEENTDTVFQEQIGKAVVREI